MLDYLVIGQGTAGSMIAYYLDKANAKFKVIDDGNKTSSSIVAAGIVNPITGKRYVKSWRIDEFLPFAKKAYEDIEKLIDSKILVERNIVRLLKDQGQENDWMSRTATAGYEQYCLEEADFSKFEGKVTMGLSFGEIQKSFQVRLFDFLPKYRSILESKNQYIKDTFDFANLIINDDYIEYNGIKAKRIIFAEGYRVIYNPYFNDMPFVPAKGEILLVRIPNADFHKMLKHNLYIVPMYDDIYWIGSNYQWDFTDSLPSPDKIQKMKEILDQVLTVPYEIVDHQAGIRPSFKNRRPTILHHPKYENLILFNGLGAKGTSLAPYWAHHLVEHLINGTNIEI